MPSPSVPSLLTTGQAVIGAGQTSADDISLRQKFEARFSFGLFGLVLVLGFGF
jgi:hypothetical protein